MERMNVSLHIGSKFLVKWMLMNASILLFTQFAASQELELGNYGKLRIEMGIGLYVGHHVDNGENISRLSLGNPRYGLPVPKGYDL